MTVPPLCRVWHCTVGSHGMDALDVVENFTCTTGLSKALHRLHPCQHGVATQRGLVVAALLRATHLQDLGVIISLAGEAPFSPLTIHGAGGKNPLPGVALPAPTAVLVLCASASQGQRATG